MFVFAQFARHIAQKNAVTLSYNKEKEVGLLCNINNYNPQ